MLTAMARPQAPPRRTHHCHRREHPLCEREPRRNREVRRERKEFAWDFDGVPQAFDLKQVAPQGTIDHSVRVYIATTLEDGGLGD